MKYLGPVLLLLVLGTLGIGIWRWGKQNDAIEHARPEATANRVRVVPTLPAPSVVKLTLPGSMRPRERVVLYARTPGFIRSWSVDLGDTVTKGQVLARIDAPELQSNLAQATARLTQAQASIALVRNQHQRTVGLQKSGGVSEQDLDTSALRLAAAESEVSAAGAEVERLKTLIGFQTVTAPFDGTVTRRFLETGALVTPGTTALYEVASTRDLRIDVDVPQWISSQISIGLPALVTVGKEGASVKATVTRTAGALDASLRTLRVELKCDVQPGTDAGISPLSGSYVRVSFEVPRDAPAILIPSGAVTVRNGQQMIASVSADNTVHFLKPTILRELGKDIEVAATEATPRRVALYPPGALNEGDPVLVVEGAP